MRKLLLTLAIFTGISQPAAANLIADGSFESYSVATDTTALVATDCTGVSAANFGTACITANVTDAWQPIAGAPNIFLEVRDGDLITPNSNPANIEVQDTTFGNVYAEINPVSSVGSGFQQTFSASAGTGDLSWYDFARGNQSDYLVFLNDAVNPIYDSSSFASDYSQWNQRSVLGVTLLNTNVLSFVSMSTNTISANIDNVVLTQVAAVPEPNAYLMLLAGIGLIALRNKKQAN